jgi:uncharacterized protein
MACKKLSIFTQVLLAILMMSLYVVALEQLSFFVNDEAGVISASFEQKIIDTLKSLRAGTSVEMVVATVNNLGGVPIEEYSLRLAHDTLGVEGKDNGALILLAVEERQYRIEIGYGLEPAVSAAAAGRIGRNVMEPYFKAGNYEEGLLHGVVALRAIIDNSSSLETQALQSTSPKSSVRATLIFLLIITFAFLLISYYFHLKEKRFNHKQSGFRKQSKNADADFAAAAAAAYLFTGRRRGGGPLGPGGGSGGGVGGFGGFGGGGFGGGGFSGRF